MISKMMYQQKKYMSTTTTTTKTTLLLSSSSSKNENDDDEMMKKKIRNRKNGLIRLNPFSSLSSSSQSSTTCNDNNDDVVEKKNKSTKRKLLRPMALATLTAFAIGNRFLGTSSSTSSSSSSFFRPAIVQARGFNIMGRDIDMEAGALDEARENVRHNNFQEAVDYQNKLKEIEETQGLEARLQYESNYENEMKNKLEQKVNDRIKLLNDLANEGKCPFTDVEGLRQVFLFDEEIDLEEVYGTVQYADAFLRDMEGVDLDEKYADARYVVQCMVRYKRHMGEDPIAFLEQNQDQTSRLYEMEPFDIKQLVARYKKQMEDEAIPEIEEFETTLDEGNEGDDNNLDPKAAAKVAKAKAKAEAARIKAEAKAQKQKEKEELALKKAEEKALKQKEKEEAKARAVAEKAAAAAAKAAAATGATAAAAAAAAAAATQAGTSIAAEGASTTQSVMESLTTTTAADDENDDTTIVNTEDDGDNDNNDGDRTLSLKLSDNNDATSKKQKPIPIIPTAAAITSIAGGTYAFQWYREKAAQEEEERQKQFRLIMGVDKDDDDNTKDDGSIQDATIEDIITPPPFQTSSSSSSTKQSAPKKDDDNNTSKPTTSVETPKKRKKKRGISSVFNKKRNSRETDLSVLLSSDDNKPLSEFSTLLAKILTFGAPGRFPNIESLSIEQQGDDEETKTFDLILAKENILSNREKAGISNEASAEAFASVVNCMIIDIIDLASSTLKEKDDKITVEAINVVMDFMDHAASLFDAVAEDVTITPVTYGGTLSKSKLEQMYGTYASSIMSSFDGSGSGSGVTQDRIDTLQQVFDITDKKAEGIVQKSMLKNLMNMMKDGKGMEGMEGLSEMMSAMGGGDGTTPPGLEGLMGGGANDGGDIDPEELKQSIQMMKELVDSGSVTKEEMNMVRSQFKEVYGSDISELIAAADGEGTRDELGEDGQELLDLFKTILKED